MVPLEKGQ